MSVAVKTPSEYLLGELKAALRERGLRTAGSKADLIERLTHYDPNIWTQPLTASVEDREVVVQDAEEMTAVHDLMRPRIGPLSLRIRNWNFYVGKEIC